MQIASSARGRGKEAGAAGGGEDGGDVQVAARGLRRPNADRLVRQETVQGVGIGGRVDGDATYPNLPTSADNAEGHLPPVCDEYLADHGPKTFTAPNPRAGCGTAAGRTPRPPSSRPQHTPP